MWPVFDQVSLLVVYGSIYCMLLADSVRHCQHNAPMPVGGESLRDRVKAGAKLPGCNSCSSALPLGRLLLYGSQPVHRDAESKLLHCLPEETPGWGDSLMPLQPVSSWCCVRVAWDSYLIWCRKEEKGAFCSMLSSLKLSKQTRIESCVFSPWVRKWDYANWLYW